MHRRKDTIADLESKVFTALNTQEEQRPNLVILLRYEPLISVKKTKTVKTEVYNLEWRKAKQVEKGPKLQSFNEEQLSST